MTLNYIIYYTQKLSLYTCIITMSVIIPNICFTVFVHIVFVLNLSFVHNNVCYLTYKNKLQWAPMVKAGDTLPAKQVIQQKWHSHLCSSLCYKKSASAATLYTLNNRSWYLQWLLYRKQVFRVEVQDWVKRLEIICYLAPTPKD